MCVHSPARSLCSKGRRRAVVLEMAEIAITLDRPNPVYQPGEVVSGTATITTDEPITVKAVKISLIGIAQAWLGGKTQPLTENIFHRSTIVWPTAGPIGYSELPLGQNRFCFSYAIPTKTVYGKPLPSPFSSEDGVSCIRYFVQVHVARSAFHFDKKLEKDFFITVAYDLNENPAAALPVEVSDSKTMGYWCCASGRIEVTARLPKSGYALGEVISLWAEINNKSGKTVEKVIVRLVQACAIVAWDMPKIEQAILARADKDQPVLPGQTQFRMNEGFLVPLTARPSHTFQNIIHFSHRLEIEVVPKFGCSSGFTVRIPVIIGTVPLASIPADSLSL